MLYTQSRIDSHFLRRWFDCQSKNRNTGKFHQRTAIEDAENVNKRRKEAGD